MPEQLTEEQKVLILQHLEDLLRARPFVGAPRQQKFLRYTIDQTLAKGEAADLREYIVAVEVFGKPTDFDPSGDSTVRSGVKRLRENLESYYEGEGRGAGVRISYPPGRYVPLFTFGQQPGPHANQPVSRAPFRSPQIVIRVAVGLFGLLIFAWFVFQHLPHSTSSSASVAHTEPPYPPRETSPSFSHDGAQIVFHSSGGLGPNHSIYRKSVDGGPIVRLTNGEEDDQNPAWSPDGKLIAFVRNPGFAGGSVQLITPEGKAFGESIKSGGNSVAWSPSSQSVAFMDGPYYEAPHEIVMVDVASRKRQTLIPPIRPGCGDFLAFSPDGTKLGFTDGEVCSLYVAMVEFRANSWRFIDKRFLVTAETFYGFDWINNQQIVVSADVGSGPILGTVSLSEKEAKITTLHPQGLPAQHPTVWRSRSGRMSRLAYEPYSSRVNLWRIDLSEDMHAKDSPASIAPSDREDESVQFSPTGLRIAFSSSRDSASYDIYVCDADGSNVRRLNAPGSFRGSARWAPDGNEIAFDALGDDHRNRDIWVADLARGTFRQVTNAASLEARPSWSRDGKWIYYTSNTSGQFEIWKLPSDSGPSARPTKVTNGGGFEAFESPDGQFLYYTKAPNIDGLWRLPTSRAGNSELVDETVSEGHWAVASRGVLFVPFARGVKAREVVFLPFAESRGRVVFQTASDASRVFPGFTVSSDGKSLVMPLVDNHGSHVTVVDFPLYAGR